MQQLLLVQIPTKLLLSYLLFCCCYCCNGQQQQQQQHQQTVNNNNNNNKGPNTRKKIDNNIILTNRKLRSSPTTTNKNVKSKSTTIVIQHRELMNNNNNLPPLDPSIIIQNSYGNQKDSQVKLIHTTTGNSNLKLNDLPNYTIQMITGHSSSNSDSKSQSAAASNSNNNYKNYIPTEFLSDIETFSFNNPKRYSFPRWSSSTSSNNNNNNVIETIIDFITEELNTFLLHTNSKYENRKQLTHTSDHPPIVPNWWFPEILYIITNQNIYVSQLAKDYIATGKGDGISKSLSTEGVMKRALNILKQQQQTDDSSVKYDVKQTWPKLYQKLIIENDGSIPLLALYSDFTGCNYNNWRNNTSSVPLFTVAAKVDCMNSIPFPNYRTYSNSKETSTEWKNIIEIENTKYPWSSKISKVVWRGSLTGYMPQNISLRGPRYHLTKLVHDTELLTDTQRNLFDIKLTYIPNPKPYLNETELGGTGKINKLDMIDFQKYKAILDIDGHSWSSRYGDLLCYNSVVLKVDPQYVDYFYYPSKIRQTTLNNDDILQPWVHFIPIQLDMSDLVAKASYVVDNDNEQHIQQIIYNANLWCQNHMIKNSVALDALDIWEEYISILDNNNNDNSLSSKSSSSSWDSKWKQVKDSIMNGPFNMVPIA